MEEMLSIGRDAFYQKWDVVQLLLLKGADPDVKDKVSTVHY
jgi:hypothetical protein